MSADTLTQLPAMRPVTPTAYNYGVILEVNDRGFWLRRAAMHAEFAELAITAGDDDRANRNRHWEFICKENAALCTQTSEPEESL